MAKRKFVRLNLWRTLCSEFTKICGKSDNDQLLSLIMSLEIKLPYRLLEYSFDAILEKASVILIVHSALTNGLVLVLLMICYERG